MSTAPSTRSTPTRPRRCCTCCATTCSSDAAEYGCGLGQCGACTVLIDGAAALSCIPGMVMRAQALLQKTPNPTEAQIRAHMSPNLCRCGTGQHLLGTGEASQGPAGAALANALADATGVRVRELPLSAARVKAALGA